MNTMTKDKKTFAWDTVLTLKAADGSIGRPLTEWPTMFVYGTDVEVKWCSVTKMYWELQTMTTLKSLLIAAESNLASYEADGDDRAISAGKIMVKGLEAAIDYEKIYLKKDEDSS